MGVLKNELGENILLVTQTTPEEKKGGKSLKSIIEADKDTQKLTESNNEVGFYVSCQLGMAFTHRNLIRMIAAYRNFRNSCMVVYDVTKSNYGLNPLKCFRLSEKAIEALNLNDAANMTDHLVQDKIRSLSLEMGSFFEEVSLKIHRSHLLQAFLFDHIQPHMPAFNTNLFRLGSSTQQMTQLSYQGSEQSQILNEELLKVEGQHKNQIKQAKKQIKKIQQQILANKDKTVKGSVGDKEDREALESFCVDDSVHSKMDLFLFSKQIDSLYESINEFDSCFPEQDLPVLTFEGKA